MASIIYCEAGNQPYEGQVAVGAVIMNRVKSGCYPNSIEEVIYQSGQFRTGCDRMAEQSQKFKGIFTDGSASRCRCAEWLESDRKLSVF